MFQRISSSDGQLGTIKYKGQIREWKEEEAFGIEWDDPKRGKNNGEVGGIQYFQPKVPGSGSFIKVSSKKVDLNTKSFVEQLKDKYASKYEEHEVTFGSKITQTYGFDQLSQMQADFGNLTVVSLDRSQLGHAGDSIKSIVPQLCNLKTLDLGFNLLGLLKDVWEVVDHMNIENLNLSGNRFEENEEQLEQLVHPAPKLRVFPITHSLKQLNITRTLPSVSQVREMLAKFPNLKDLALVDNMLTDSQVEEIFTDIRLAELESVDFSMNSLTRLPDIVSKLTESNLSYNNIKKLNPTECTWKPGKLKKLDLRYNEIDEWREIDRLFCLDLQAIRINGNPLFADLLVEDMTIRLIARFHSGPDHLTTLNGSFLTVDEINNAELYYVLMAQQNKSLDIDFLHPNWLRLADKYKVTVSLQKSAPAETHLQLLMIPLLIDIEWGSEKLVHKKVFLRTATVLSVKGLVSRLLNNISVLNIELSYLFAEREGGAKSIVFQCEDNFALLDSLGLEPDQVIYARVKGNERDEQSGN